MKKSADVHQINYYTINAEKIELKGDSISTTSTWQFIIKLIEQEKYFLLMPTARSFHYLPKEAFESKEDIARFREMEKEKGIKMTFH
jgi:hypothetical protein